MFVSFLLRVSIFFHIIFFDSADFEFIVELGFRFDSIGFLLDSIDISMIRLILSSVVSIPR